MKMKKLILGLSILLGTTPAWCAPVETASPDGKLRVSTDIIGGKPVYSVSYNGKTILENSPLGFLSNEGDFSTGMSFVSSEKGTVSKSFDQDKIKKSHIDYNANRLVTTLKNAKGGEVSVEWLVSDNDIAFRYLIPRQGEIGSMVVEKEATGYRFPEQTPQHIYLQNANCGQDANAMTNRHSRNVWHSDMRQTPALPYSTYHSIAPS